MKKIELKFYEENFAQHITKDAALVTAGTINNYNTMTIGWAHIGNIWGRETVIVYVRPSRYTYKFMEENDYFTVSFYDNNHKKALGFLGTRSGKDLDKVKEVGFHAIELNNSVSFQEARITFVLKKIYHQDLDSSLILNEIKDKYYKDNCYHRVYIGEIEEIIMH
ncbi:MAG: flavin reductase [Bacilli bacterium]|jgi:flavin reductase (DIM6/NTAB) family NADH-FMN oxidoreductase RutF|nr:flavin reductase family protein [Bacilli bacterium]MDD2682193.1 flavin reductase family protein [Bacilli bacterium]MDD3121436.1 flavin reductase family protein [Bacilli bacterium]MDD4063295.1 flavin reductase family protein [Bacilli bacterium]MDD4482177.1 flavin reductase family protein [Bacilli bacterium]